MDDTDPFYSEEYRLRGRERIAPVLAAIDQEQAHHPKCRLCGQRARQLDKYGLCSKVSVAHEAARAGRSIAEEPYGGDQG